MIPLKIGFDAKRAFFNKSGLGNYSRNLINSLVKFYPENSYYLFTPSLKNRINLSHQAEKLAHIVGPKHNLKFLQSIWRTYYISSKIEKFSLDIYHGLSHELPYGIHKTKVKRIVTVHDLIFIKFPRFYSKIDVKIYKAKLKYALEAANVVVAISNQTRDDLISIFDLNPQKIKVIYQSCNEWFYNNYTNESINFFKKQNNLQEPYLLYIGTIEERKNLLTLLKALKLINKPIPLVVVGKKTNYYYTQIKPFLENTRLNVQFLTNISNEELPMLYQNAQCFIYPSIYEGFGIPILEALVSGIPVITTKGGCFEETGGNAAIYVDPFDINALANAIDKIISDANLRHNMINHGIKHAKQFHPGVIANNYMNLYRDLEKL